MDIEVSVVSPVYQAAAIVPELVRRISAALAPLGPAAEIVLVEDGGADDSWTQIEACCRQDDRVKGIKLSRNFGQHRAITAGIAAARGRYIVVMDCDLQDDPAYIPALLERAREGYDVVLARRQQRQHSRIKNLSAHLYFRVFSALVERPEMEANASVGSYSLLSRKAADALLSLRDYHRHYLMLVRWVGFRVGYIDVVHAPRFAGESSYSWGRLLSHALDGIVSQSDRLLYLSVQVGFGLAALAALSIVYLITRYFLFGLKEGWTSLMVVLLLSTGLILMSIGITGIYIAKIFEQSKDRPLYIIDRKVNL